MAPRYITPASADGTVRVLQLTDCHLFADESKDLLGVNTSESFKINANQLGCLIELYDQTLDRITDEMCLQADKY